MRILLRYLTKPDPPIFGPFTATIQTRFKKPANTAQTRLQTRTLDPKLDLAAFHHRRLSLILSLHTLILSSSKTKRRRFVSLQLLSRWAPHSLPLVRKHPHVLDAFTHPVRRNACVRFASKFVELIDFENRTVSEFEERNVEKLRKVLMMSVDGRIHLHAVRLMRREFGFPEGFMNSIIRKHGSVFRMVGLEIVELIEWNEYESEMGQMAEVEKWREREYKEKWLSEFETKYAFPIRFPTGFRIRAGFREKLRNWQRLSYVKPYERIGKVRVRTCGGKERYEKRAVAVIHELLCLTVEKMVEIERLAHFRKDLGIEVNLREVLLKHPGIFYVSVRGNTQFVFLREAYCSGFLVELCPVYEVRRRMLELIALGGRNTRELRQTKEVEEAVEDIVGEEIGGGMRDGDFVIPILENHVSSKCEPNV